MSKSISDVLDVNREYRRPYGLKAEKTINRITFNPSTANPGDTLYVHIPKLSDNVVLVPGSIGLIFKLNKGTGAHANNTLVNNIGHALISRMRVLYGGETLQDTQRIDLYNIYGDLFLLKRERDNMLREGISSSNMRKLRTAAGDKVTTDAAEVALSQVHGSKYRIPINHPILDSHGVFYPKALRNTLTFEITLPPHASITISSDLSKSYTYDLSNIELEYECIVSEDLAREAQVAYQVSKGFYYENILLHKTFTIDKAATTVVNEHVNIPRRSMTGILCLFTESYTAGARDTEKFVNPNITKVEVNVDGMPNKLYSKGMLPTDFWDSIIRRYGQTDNLTQKDFYKDKFALWVDLRTYPSNEIHGNGLLLNSTKDGVKLQINREVHGTGNITCHMYVVADALMEIVDSDLKSILY